MYRELRCRQPLARLTRVKVEISLVVVNATNGKDVKRSSRPVFDVYDAIKRDGYSALSRVTNAYNGVYDSFLAISSINLSTHRRRIDISPAFPIRCGRFGELPNTVGGVCEVLQFNALLESLRH